VKRMFAMVVLIAAAAPFAAAQNEGLQPFKPGGVLKKVPEGVILVKGAEPSASDSKTPLPENGRFANDAYKNDYFGITFQLPPQIAQKYEGPPPSDSGKYVLTQLEPTERFTGADRPLILISAQDQFFGLTGDHRAAEAVKSIQEHLPSYYEAEHPPSEVTIAGRTFLRFDYRSPVAGIHWAVLATDIRCHTVQVVVSGRDPKTLDAMIAGLAKMKVETAAETPVCIAGYAEKNTLFTKDPVLPEHKYNAIPVRITIDTKGKVKHVHVLSAFPEQARAITDALFQWRFKPYEVNGEAKEVETGILFGAGPRRPVTPATVASE
jgi:hypothetical protein